MRRTAWLVVATFGLLSVGRVEAHGFVISVGGGGSGGTTGAGAGGFTSGGAGTSRAPTPGSGGSTLRGNRGGGGATKPGGGGGGLPFGLGKRGDDTLRTDDAGVKGTPANLPTEPAARGKAFKNLLRDDVKGSPDVSFVLDVATTDARMRSVDLRVKAFERRIGFGDVRRRFEVSVKNGSGYDAVETILVRRSGGVLLADRWSSTGGVARLSNPLEQRVAGTSLTLGDLFPYEPAMAEFKFGEVSELDSVRHETYSLKIGAEERATVFRTDFRAPVRMDVKKHGIKVRAYDWNGWRFVSGVPTPGRIVVSGASAETVATMEVSQAAASASLDADLFDVAKLGAGAVADAK
ncbi:MAG TPA: hypothetical protein VEI02_03595 [Planctomycetota bacterium]|nr:hypothetical protein [Planctomycetota bacterium]